MVEFEENKPYDVSITMNNVDNYQIQAVSLGQYTDFSVHFAMNPETSIFLYVLTIMQD